MTRGASMHGPVPGLTPSHPGVARICQCQIPRPCDDISIANGHASGVLVQCVFLSAEGCECDAVRIISIGWNLLWRDARYVSTVAMADGA